MRRTNTVAAPFILPVCCLCHRVADDEAEVSDAWMPLQAYLDRHHLTACDYQLSHTYCPSCYVSQAQAWDLPSIVPSLPNRSVRRLRSAR